MFHFLSARKPEPADLSGDILAVLWDGPRHGFDIIVALEERLGAPPPPESIYPELRLLEEGDFITGREVGGRRVYAIADRGSRLLADLSAR